MSKSSHRDGTCGISAQHTNCADTGKDSNVGIEEKQMLQNFFFVCACMRVCRRGEVAFLFGNFVWAITYTCPALFDFQLLKDFLRALKFPILFYTYPRKLYLRCTTPELGGASSIPPCLFVKIHSPHCETNLLASEAHARSTLCLLS